MTLTIRLHLDPPARFVSGTHFLGGQSTSSSVSGVYRFEGPEGALYRVRIPVTELTVR